MDPYKPIFFSQNMSILTYNDNNKQFIISIYIDKYMIKTYLPRTFL